MSNIERKIRKNKEKKTIKVLFGKEPKHACKVCGKMTLFVDGACIRCNGMYAKREEEFKERYAEYVKQQLAKGEVNE